MSSWQSEARALVGVALVMGSFEMAAVWLFASPMVAKFGFLGAVTLSLAGIVAVFLLLSAAAVAATRYGWGKLGAWLIRPLLRSSFAALLIFLASMAVDGVARYDFVNVGLLSAVAFGFGTCILPKPHDPAPSPA